MPFHVLFIPYFMRILVDEVEKQLLNLMQQGIFYRGKMCLITANRILTAEFIIFIYCHVYDLYILLDT